MRTFPFVLLAVLAIGCGKDPSGPVPIARYDLVRVNGLPLPYVRLQTGTVKEEVLGGRIDLFATNTYVDIATFRTAEGNLVQKFDVTLQGPYTMEGTTLTFTVISEEDQTGDDKYTGTIVGDTLVVQVGNTVWKYAER